MFKALRRIQPLYILADWAIMAAVFCGALFLRYGDSGIPAHHLLVPHPAEYSMIFALWALVLTFCFKRKGLYCTNRSMTVLAEAGRVFACMAYAAVAVAAVIFFAQYKFFSRQIFLLSVVFLAVALSGWRTVKRLILRRMIARGFHNLNVLIIGTGKPAQTVLEEIRKVPWWGFRVAGYLDDRPMLPGDEAPFLGGLADFAQVARKHFIDEVIITRSLAEPPVSALVRQAQRSRVGVRVLPLAPLELMDNSAVSYIGDLPLITYKERIHHPSDFAMKRLIDCALSLTLLTALSPLLVVIAILIKLDSAGPVLFRQKRCGLKGRPFELYKFRSMVKGADSLKQNLLKHNEVKDGVIFKLRQDPRATTIGRFLRKYSLDELPQLWNVVKGDMSLVGPRPPTVDEVKRYDAVQMQRLSIRPGLTGLSQVRGRSDLLFKQWVRWDLWYINNWSLRLDLAILMRSVPVVLRGEGAY